MSASNIVDVSKLLQKLHILYPAGLKEIEYCPIDKLASEPALEEGAIE